MATIKEVRAYFVGDDIQADVLCVDAAGIETWHRKLFTEWSTGVEIINACDGHTDDPSKWPVRSDNA